MIDTLWQSTSARTEPLAALGDPRGSRADPSGLGLVPMVIEQSGRG